MATGVIVILHANNERQIFQHAIAEKEGNRLRIYRDTAPGGLAERQLVAEFALHDVKSWFPVGDTHREA
jgi:hypothetical protein